MKKLLIQIIKFSIVGAIAFLIDFAIYTISCNVIGIHYIISGFLGFSISLIFNYLASMRFVFKSKGGSKVKESVIFAILSVIGLGINELILYLCIDVVYQNSDWLLGIINDKWMNVLAKVIATGVVMVYNFISRKIFLEDHSEKVAEPEVLTEDDLERELEKELEQKD